MIASYSPHTVRSCSEDQNFMDRHVLHRQSEYVSRTGCHAGTRVHQHSGAGAAHSNGKVQLAQRFSNRLPMTMSLSHSFLKYATTHPGQSDEPGRV